MTLIEIQPNYKNPGGWTAHDVPKEDLATLPLRDTKTELSEDTIKAFESCIKQSLERRFQEITVISQRPILGDNNLWRHRQSQTLPAAVMRRF